MSDFNANLKVKKKLAPMEAVHFQLQNMLEDSTNKERVNTQVFMWFIECKDK